MAVGGFALGFAACSDEPTAPDGDIAALLDVVPAPGSIDVTVGTSVTVAVWEIPGVCESWPGIVGTAAVGGEIGSG